MRLDLITLGSGAGVVDRSVQSCRRTLSGEESGGGFLSWENELLM